MHIALWIVQWLLAFMFLFVGGVKVFAFDRYTRMQEQRSPGRGPGLSRPLATFIGICELAGGAGVVLPLATGTAPWLTPLAAAGLATIMALAVIYHRRRGEPVPPPVVVLFVLAFVVAVGRSIGA